VNRKIVELRAVRNDLRFMLQLGIGEDECLISNYEINNQ